MLHAGAWVLSSPGSKSAIWYVTTIKYRDFDRQRGTLAQHIIAAVVKVLHGYPPLPDD
nr:hypothetical protein [Halocatena marina]